MSDVIRLRIDGRTVSAKPGTTVAVAVLDSGITRFRRSVSGEWRGPICGMGICFECRVNIDGRPHQRSCQIMCREGMRVTTE